MTDQERLHRALDIIANLLAALLHAERFGNESATGCRDRALIKSKAVKFLEECNDESRTTTDSQANSQQE